MSHLLNSPSLTGIPTTPTASLGTSTTQIASTAFVAGAVTNLLNTNSQPKTGFPDRTSTTLTFVPATRTVTLAPTGASFTVCVNGVLFTKTAQTSVLANVTADYYCYFDTAGTFQTSASIWDILTTAPVAMIHYDATLVDGFALDERHTDQMDVLTHKYLHFVNGTEVISGFAASGYGVAGSAGDATTATNTFAIAAGTIADEDIFFTTSALADGTAYTIFSRTGASGTWTWTKANTLPYLVGTTYPKYNQWTGATWQMTEISSTQFVNYFVFVTTSIDTAFQYIIIPGQTVYNSLAAARAETYSALTFGTLPFSEIAPLYQITIRAGTGTGYNGVSGSCRFELFSRILGTRSSIGSYQPSVHNGLSGLQGGSGTDFYHLSAAEYTLATTQFAGSTAGLVPTSAGGTTNFLRADGTWAAAGGGGGGSSSVSDSLYLATMFA